MVNGGVFLVRFFVAFVHKVGKPSASGSSFLFLSMLDHVVRGAGDTERVDTCMLRLMVWMEGGNESKGQTEAVEDEVDSAGRINRNQLSFLWTPPFSVRGVFVFSERILEALSF
ncbi:hypothetical protein IWX50DRAFT_627793 [Phyllosticta citricarpa]